MGQLKIIGIFDNVSTRMDGVTTVRFKFPYSEIAAYSRLLLNLGKEMRSIVVNETGDKFSLGMVSIKQLAIDKDGEAKLTVIGDVGGIDIGKISNLLEQQIAFYTKVYEGGGGEELVENDE